jgi:hypothetical protein
MEDTECRTFAFGTLALVETPFFGFAMDTTAAVAASILSCSASLAKSSAGVAA